MTAPAVVRNLWSKASPESQIRRKWPTMAALNAAAAEGFFDDLRTNG